MNKVHNHRCCMVPSELLHAPETMLEHTADRKPSDNSTY